MVQIVHTKSPVTVIDIEYYSGEDYKKAPFRLKAYIAMESITSEQRKYFRKQFSEGMLQLTSDYSVGRFEVSIASYRAPDRRLLLKIHFNFIGEAVYSNAETERIRVRTEYGALAYAVMLPLIKTMLANSSTTE